jgi:hypothetical protein
MNFDREAMLGGFADEQTAWMAGTSPAMPWQNMLEPHFLSGIT